MKSYTIALIALLSTAALQGMKDSSRLTINALARELYNNIPQDPGNRRLCAAFATERKNCAQNILSEASTNRCAQLFANVEFDALNPDAMDHTKIKTVDDNLHIQYANTLAKLAKTKGVTMEPDNKGYFELSFNLASALLENLNRTLMPTRPNSPLRRS